jgi:type IV secretory pathway VirB9-like protein
MKRLYLTGILWAVIAHSAPAEQPAAASPEATPALATVTKAVGIPVLPETKGPAYGGVNPTLNPQQAAGVEITRQWEDKSYAAMVQQPGPDGAVVFKYGECLPTIVCQTLNITDVELQPGEIVNEVKCGDAEGWSVEPAVSGDATKTEHLIIKPKDIGLQTSLVVTTDHRTYCLRLLSTGDRFMHRVAFVYHDAPVVSVPVSVPKTPETPRSRDQAGVARVAQVSAAEPVPVKRKVLLLSEGKGSVKAGPSEPSEDDGYRICGRAPWKPGRVYNDGTKTYIQMPRHVEETPALFLVRKGGIFGLGHQKNIVNYRVKGRWYVVDSVIDRAALVVGTGSGAEKVTITKRK